MSATSKADSLGLANKMRKDQSKLERAWQSKANSMIGKKYKNKESYERELYKHWDRIIRDWMNENASNYGFDYRVE